MRSLTLCGLWVTLWLSSACGIIPTPAPPVSPTADPTPSATADVQALTPIPTVETTQTPPETLKLWWPDALLPTGESAESLTLLNSQIAAFTAEEGVIVETRLKRVRDAGSITSSLRSAQGVAPGVIPDLTLLRREDLALVAQQGVIFPLEGSISSVILADLYPSVLELGQVDGTLYGLPFTIETQHVVYDPATTPPLDANLNTYLEHDAQLIFSASRATNGVNSVFFTQYLLELGLNATTGSIPLEADALEQTLMLYQTGRDAGTFPPQILNYAAPEDYFGLIGRADFVGGLIVSGNQYWANPSWSDNYDYVSIPTGSGMPTTTLNGWMWVLTTNDPNRRERAAAFLRWMMAAERQGEYLRTLNQLPSQRAAVRLGYSEDYDRFTATLMENAVLPLVDASGSPNARALQTALLSVLSGEEDAQQATLDALAQASS